MEAEEQDRVDFSERVSSVFGTLNATLKSFSDSPCKQDPDNELKQTRQSRDHKPSSHSSRDRSPHRRQHHVTKEARRPARVPDHMAHPKKWTKYDLSDDGSKNSDFEGLTSDQVNRKAAFEFLDALKHKDSETTPSDTSLPLKFKRPAKPRVVKEVTSHGGSQSSVSGHSSSGGAAAVVMPEYVVGAKQQRTVARRAAAASSVGSGASSGAVILSHLDNEEEEQ